MANEEKRQKAKKTVSKTGSGKAPDKKKKDLLNAKLLIHFDWAMKRLLRQKANYTVLEGFLSVLLNEKIKIINIKESEANQESVTAKFNRVDIFVENSHSELMIIEMQNSDEVDYFFTIHRNDLLQLTEEQKEFFAGEKRHSAKAVKDLYPEYYILCVEDFNNVAKSSLDEWIYYLKNNDIPEEFTASGLEEARKRLQYDKLSEQEKRDYDYHLEQRLYEQGSINTAIRKGERKGIAKGLAKGLAKGEAERKKLKAEKEAAQAKLEEKMKTMVFNCHHAGFPIETISSITGLTPEQIIEILES